MAYTHRYVRVTASGKIEDRFLTVQVSKPEEPAKTNYGTIFNLVEITSRWFPTSQIAQSTINTLRREYFKGASTSDLENFENAIKKVNEQLATITQQGETEWIGNLHAELVLLNDNDAHLCGTGSARGYLIRDGKVIQISQPRDAESETPPLKTFSSITSGTLKDHDNLLVVSSSLHDHINNEDIKEAFREGSPYQAALYLVRLLKRHKVHNVAFAIIEVLTENSAANYPLGEPEVIYLDKPLEKPIDKAKRVFTNYVMPTAVKTAHIFKKHVVPQSAKLAKLVSHHARKTADLAIEKGKPLAQKVIQQTKESVSQIKIPTKKQGPDSLPDQEGKVEADSLIGKTIFNIHDYTSQAKPKRRLNIPLYSPLAWHRLVLFIRNPRNRPLLYIIWTIILVFILVISVSVQKKNEKATSQATQSKTAVDQAKRRLEEGKTALIFNNKTEAQLAFTDAIKLAKDLNKSPKFEQESKKIIDEAETELDKLVGSNRLKNLTSAVSFGKAGQIAASKGKVVSLDQESQTLEAGDLIDGQVRPISGLDGKATAITATSDKILILTENSIYQFNPETVAIEKVPLADDAKVFKGVDLGSFVGNLYILSPSDNQIWKYQPKDGVFQKATGFLKGSVKISGGIGMAIDGSIYVLSQEGKVQKFSQGNLQQFSLTGLPKGLEKIEKPLTLFTSEESSSIFIAEGGSLPRILEFDKQGKFLQQFLFQSDLDDLKDAWFQPTGRKAWALFGNSVYELNL